MLGDGGGGRAGVKSDLRDLLEGAAGPPPGPARPTVHLVHAAGAGSGGVSTLQRLLYGPLFGSGASAPTSDGFSWPEAGLAEASSIRHAALQAPPPQLHPSLAHAHVPGLPSLQLQPLEPREVVATSTGSGAGAQSGSAPTDPVPLVWQAGVNAATAGLPGFADALLAFTAVHVCDLPRTVALVWMATCQLDPAGLGGVWAGLLQPAAAPATPEDAARTLNAGLALVRAPPSLSDLLPEGQSLGRLPGAAPIPLHLVYVTSSNAGAAEHALEGVVPRVRVTGTKDSRLGSVASVLRGVLTPAVQAGLDCLHLWTVRLARHVACWEAAWSALQSHRRGVAGNATAMLGHMVHEVGITLRGVAGWLRGVVVQEGCLPWLQGLGGDLASGEGVTTFTGLRALLVQCVQSALSSSLLVAPGWSATSPGETAIPPSTAATQLAEVLSAGGELCANVCTWAEAPQAHAAAECALAFRAFQQHHRSLLAALLTAAGRRGGDLGDQALAAAGIGHVTGLLQAVDWNGHFARRYGLGGPE